HLGGYAYPVVSARHEMLWSRIIRGFQQVPCASNATVRRGGPSRSQTEQCLKGGHRLLPPIVSKDELIEVDLELSAADTVISAEQPLLEVADRAVGQRDHGFGTLAQIDSQRLQARDVFVPGFLQAREGFQTVGVDRGALSDVLLDEGAQRDRLKVWDHTHRSRPEALPRFSTATNTRAARRPLSSRLPRKPAWVPPIQLSSISTSPWSGSRAILTI